MYTNLLQIGYAVTIMPNKYIYLRNTNIHNRNLVRNPYSTCIICFLLNRCKCLHTTLAAAFQILHFMADGPIVDTLREKMTQLSDHHSPELMQRIERSDEDVMVRYSNYIDATLNGNMEKLLVFGWFMLAW